MKRVQIRCSRPTCPGRLGKVEQHPGQPPEPPRMNCRWTHATPPQVPEERIDMTCPRCGTSKRIRVARLVAALDALDDGQAASV